MMATTHALAGALLAVSLLFVAPEHTPVAFAAGVSGGLFPDLDLYAAHRRTLHYPVYYSVAALAALAVVFVVPSTVTVAVSLFLVSAALHSASDIAGGGLELRPWRGVSERAVYDHYRGRWIRPRRWIRYDGSPEDLLLAIAVAVPALAVYEGSARRVVLALLVVSGIYTLLRKPLVSVAEWLVGRIPEGFRRYVPDRFIEDLQ